MAYRRKYRRSYDRYGMFSAKDGQNTSTENLFRKHFDDVTQYLEWIKECKDANRGGSHGGSYLWSDYQSSYSSLRGDDWNAKTGWNKLNTGDNEAGERFAAMSGEFQEDIYVERRVWTHSVAGAFPDVGAMLSGRPDSMWTRKVELNTREPLRIWIGLTSSAGVTPTQLEKRGAALAAFAIAMSSHRPVLLTPYVNLGGTPGTGALISFDLSTNPVIYSEVAAALAAPSVTRALGIYACYCGQRACTGAWWRDYDNPERMREQLGCKEADVYLGSIHMSDPLLTDPAQWIKDNLSHLLRDDRAHTEEEI